jgi:hypothetical protein
VPTDFATQTFLCLLFIEIADTGTLRRIAQPPVLAKPNPSPGGSVGTAQKYAISRMAITTECLILNRYYVVTLTEVYIYPTR